MWRCSKTPTRRCCAKTYQTTSPDARLAEPGESAEAYGLRCAEALAQYLEQHHASTAALIVEPLVQCAGGHGDASSNLFEARARELAASSACI